MLFRSTSSACMSFHSSAFHTPTQGGAGIIPMPKGYLKAAFEVIRESGGLCISDEVSNTHVWYLMHTYVHVHPLSLQLLPPICVCMHRLPSYVYFHVPYFSFFLSFSLPHFSNSFRLYIYTYVQVQTGFTRFGSHYWGFESMGVVPDIGTCTRAK